MTIEFLVQQEILGQATKGKRVDALVRRGDEGRGKLRKASVSCKQTMTRGFPNGATRLVERRAIRF